MFSVDISESVEMYLEAILELEAKNSVVRSVDIARFLGVTKPSVNHAMTNLKNEGYILMEPYGDIVFTEKGRETAAHPRTAPCHHRFPGQHAGHQPELPRRTPAALSM